MSHIRRWLLWCLVWLVGAAAVSCGPPAWTGKYSATSLWNLGGPLANGRTIGDSVADLLVEQTVALIGVPSLLERPAESALDALVRGPVKAVVDPRAPAQLAPGGTVYEPLARALAQVKTESELELASGRLPRSLTGTEHFGAFEFVLGSVTHRLEATALSDNGVSIRATWSGRETSSAALDIEPHEVELRFGELVRRIADLIVDATQQTDLRNRVVAAVACDQIVTRISPSGSGVVVSVSDWSYQLSAAELRQACDSMSPLLAARALGMVKIDSRVEVGGPVLFQAPTRELRSESTFGGLVKVAPRAIAPRLEVDIAAKPLAQR